MYLFKGPITLNYNLHDVCIRYKSSYDKFKETTDLILDLADLTTIKQSDIIEPIKNQLFLKFVKRYLSEYGTYEIFLKLIKLEEGNEDNSYYVELIKWIIGGGYKDEERGKCIEYIMDNQDKVNIKKLIL